MKPQDVAASYNVLASRWSDPSFDRTNGIEQHARAIAFTAARGPALDVGCGSSGRFIDILREHGFRAEGLDISEEMLRLARERHPDVAFHHADIVTWEPQHSYDFITAWDSIWHAPLASQRDVLLKLCGMLLPGGVLITTMGGLDVPGETEDASMGEPMYHATIGIPAMLRTVLDAGCTLRHLEFDQWPELHVSVVVQRPTR